MCNIITLLYNTNTLRVGKEIVGFIFETKANQNINQHMFCTEIVKMAKTAPYPLLINAYVFSNANRYGVRKNNKKMGSSSIIY